MVCSLHSTSKPYFWGSSRMHPVIQWSGHMGKNYKQCQWLVTLQWGSPSSFMDVWVSNYLRWPMAFSMKAPARLPAVVRFVCVHIIPNLPKSTRQGFPKIVNHQPANQEDRLVKELWMQGLLFPQDSRGQVSTGAWMMSCWKYLDLFGEVMPYSTHTHLQCILNYIYILFLYQYIYTHLIHTPEKDEPAS